MLKYDNSFYFTNFFIHKIYSTYINAKSSETGPMLGGELIDINDKSEVPQKEKLDKEFITGPEGSYEIQEIPEGWTCKQTTLREYISEGLGISDSGLGNKYLEFFPEIKNILVLKSKIQFCTNPIPGETKYDGRKIPSALGGKFSISLAIIPIERFQSPYYIKQTIYSNVIKFVSSIDIPITKISQDTIPNLSKKNITIELVSKIEKIYVNNKIIEKVYLNILVIAIEGDAEDFMLFISYPSKPDGLGLPGTEQDITKLRNLANSFRPKQRAAIEQIRTNYKEEAKKKFSEFLEEDGKKFLYNQLPVLFMKLDILDLNLPKNIVESINMLKIFRQASENLQIEDKDLEELWNAVDEAEAGDSTKLKKEITKNIEKIKKNSDARFYMDFVTVFAKLNLLDLNIKENITKIIDMLKPLILASENLQIEDKDLEELWNAVDEAEAGDSTKLKKKITKTIEEIKKTNNEPSKELKSI